MYIILYWKCWDERNRKVNKSSKLNRYKELTRYEIKEDGTFG